MFAVLIVGLKYGLSGNSPLSQRGEVRASRFLRSIRPSSMALSHHMQFG